MHWIETSGIKNESIENSFVNMFEEMSSSLKGLLESPDELKRYLEEEE